MGSAAVIPFHSKDNPQTVYQSYSFWIESPDGNITVIVAEGHNGKPCAIFIHVGKTGSQIAAWADAAARSVTRAFDNGATLENVIEDFSNISTDKYRINSSGYKCRSAVEAVAIALLRYRDHKTETLMKELGINDKRPSRIGRR